MNHSKFVAVAKGLIEQSISEDCIAHAEHSEPLALALQHECEDSVENGRVVEYWGTHVDEQTAEEWSWRVHLAVAS